MAIVLGATALIGGASALYFRATMTQNHEEYVEARVFAPPSSWFEATTLVAEVSITRGCFRGVSIHFLVSAGCTAHTFC